jgi:hypothetical protein
MSFADLRQQPLLPVLKVISSSTGELQPVFRRAGKYGAHLWGQIRQSGCAGRRTASARPMERLSYVEFLRSEQVFLPKPDVDSAISETKEVYHLADKAVAHTGTRAKLRSTLLARALWS